MNRVVIGGDNECTAYPWWAIIDPRQKLVNSHNAVNHVASQITGPFFSRASAEQTLAAKRHRFGRHAVVYCFSGHMSPDWKTALESTGGVK